MGLLDFLSDPQAQRDVRENAANLMGAAGDGQFWGDVFNNGMDALNRGMVGGLLGAPVDMATGVANAGLMGGGYLGHKLGLLSVDQMPEPITKPVGGSEWFGDRMQDAGMVSGNRNPLAEVGMSFMSPGGLVKGGQLAGAAAKKIPGILAAARENAAGPSFGRSPLGAQMGAVGNLSAGRTAKALDAEKNAQAFKPKPSPSEQTVMRPKRYGYDVYNDIPGMVAEAESRVAPENPLLKNLLGTSREELADIAKRPGNMDGVPFKLAPGSKGAKHAGEVMNPRNEKRLLSILEEAKSKPGLHTGMKGWYVMDPLFDKMKSMYGPKEASKYYDRFNALTSMSSPGSDVLTEINRGTGANWLAEQGRFGDFKQYAGMAEKDRGAGFPDDVRGIMGHPYHSTAQAPAMEKFINGGLLDMKSAKVPSYYRASSVPDLGFQTKWPVGDAHWSRAVGLTDVRNSKNVKGKEVLPNASASVPEMASLGPWWSDRIAKPMGMEGVPAQALLWGAVSGRTGVDSPIGAPKLELLMMQVQEAAQRMGVSNEKALDLIMRGQAHAG